MRIFLVVVCLISGASIAQAREWVLGVGFADFSNHISQDQVLTTIELHGAPFYESRRLGIGMAGTVETHAHGDFFVGAGLAGLYEINERWFMEGSVMPGYYQAASALNDLGNDFEIRSLLGVGYSFRSGTRLSLAVSHISNASTAPFNPGVNSIQLRLRRQF